MGDSASPAAWKDIATRAAAGNLTGADKLVLFPSDKAVEAFDNLAPHLQQRAIRARLRSLKANAAALELSTLIDQKASRIIESGKPLAFPRRVLLNLAALPFLCFISYSSLASYFRTTSGTRIDVGTAPTVHSRVADKDVRLSLPGTVIARTRDPGGNWTVHYAFCAPPAPAAAAAFGSERNAGKVEQLLRKIEVQSTHSSSSKQTSATDDASSPTPSPVLSSAAQRVPFVQRARNAFHRLRVEAWFTLWGLSAPPPAAIANAAAATLAASKATSPTSSSSPSAAGSGASTPSTPSPLPFAARSPSPESADSDSSSSHTDPLPVIPSYREGAAAFVSSTITAGYPAGPTEFHPFWPTSLLKVGDKVTVLVPTKRLTEAAERAAVHAGVDGRNVVTQRSSSSASPSSAARSDGLHAPASGKQSSSDRGAVSLGDLRRPIPITDCCLSDRPPFVRIFFFVFITGVTMYDTWRRARAYQVAWRLDQARLRGEWPFNNASKGAMAASLSRDTPHFVKSIFSERVAARFDALHAAATKAIESGGGDSAKARALLERSGKAPRALLEERSEVVAATKARYESARVGGVVRDAGVDAVEGGAGGGVLGAGRAGGVAPGEGAGGSTSPHATIESIQRAAGKRVEPPPLEEVDFASSITQGLKGVRDRQR